MTSGDRIQLIVQGDDFGMCHAVNQGVVEAFSEGILTQSSFMAACPWADEALFLSRERGIPLGLHQTLTCDWEYLRWGPLTRGDSLGGADGFFRATVADAAASVDPVEATEELLRQARRVEEGGCALGYLDVHMGMVCPAAYQSVSERLGLPFLYPGLTTSLSFTSIRGLSERPADQKKDWLLGWLKSLTPGRHLLVTHPGVPGPELSALTSPSSPVYRWAQEYRASDLAVLTDPEVGSTVTRVGIELTTVAGAGAGSA